MTRFRKALALGLVAGTLGLALRLTNVGVRLEEDVALRWLFLARGPVAPPPQVAVVSIDKSSAQQIGLDTGEWPPRRHVHARVVRSLASHGTSAVVMDILFATNRSAVDDDDLADAIARSGNIILAQGFDRLRLPGADVEIEQLNSPIDQLQKSAIGLAPFPLPEGPQVHFFWPFFPTTAGEIPTLPALALQVHGLSSLDRLRTVVERSGGMDLRDMPSRISSVAELRRLMAVLRRELGQDRGGAARALALVGDDNGDDSAARANGVLTALLTLYADGGRSYLNFYGPAGTIETIPFHRLFSDGRNAPGSLAGKVVFVGEGAAQFITTADQLDTYRTAYSRSDGVDLSGAEISATAFANLLTRRVIKTVGQAELAALLLGFGVFSGLAARLLPGAYGAVAAVGLGAAYSLAAFFLFARHSLLVPVAIPLFVQLPVTLFAGLFGRYRDVRRQVPIEVDPSAGQQLFEGICLATDVSGYTALAARMNPAALGQLLEAYYDTIRRVVNAHGGMVWGRGGDSSLSLWKGHPRSRHRLQARAWLGRNGDTETHTGLRLSACLAAIEIRDAIRSFNARHPETHKLDTRIGLDAGEVSFGPLAGELQAVGTSANVASRLQELNKLLSTRILASRSVVADLEGLLLRPLGLFALAGLPIEVSVFEVLGRMETASDQDRLLCEQFAAGLELYEKQDWPRASGRFQELALIYPDDGPIGYYRDLSRRFAAGL